MSVRQRGGVRAAAVITCLLATLFLPAARASAGPGGLIRIGKLPLQNGQELVADAKTRRLIAIAGGALQASASVVVRDYTPLTLAAYDGDSLRLIRRATFEPAVWPQAGRGGRAMVFAADSSARRLYVLVYDSVAKKDNAAAPSLLVIDEDTLATIATLPLATVAPPSVRVLGIKLEQSGRALLVTQTVPALSPPLLFAVEAPRASGVFLSEIDLTSGTVTWGPVSVRGCQSPITNQSQSAIAVRGSIVFIGCATVQVLNVPGPGVAAIAAIDRATTTNQHLSFLPGSYATGDDVADDEAGRLLLVSSAAGHPNQAVWVFDLEHRTFVGQVAAGEADIFGAGLDPQSGRTYVGINNTLLVTSDRGYEIPQALTFPSDVNIGQITPIPFNRRVVVPVHGPNASWVFAVYKDTLPDGAFSAGAVPDASNIDRLTSEVPQFSASAQAYGIRIHTIGGLNSLLQNVLAQGGNYWSQAGNITGLKDGDRDLVLSKVVRAHLAEGEASAESISGDPDPNTASDYVTIARRAPNALGQEWPYAKRECRDFGDGSAPIEAPDGHASCSLAKNSVATGALHDGVALPGILSIASSASSATLQLDAANRLIATVHAEARDVRISDSVRIGEVSSDVIVRAAGVRGAAVATYQRTFRDVTAGSFQCGATCAPEEVLAAFTDTLGAQFRVELPGDEKVATTGGSHAHAVREPWGHEQDVVLNNQDPTQQQVAALRLTYINDGTLASRAVIELAATAADATKLRVVPGVTPPGPVVPPVVLRNPLPGFVSYPAMPARPKIVITPEVPAKVVRVLGHGWKLLTTGGPGMVVRAIALWALFAAPLFFATRRRLLVRLREGPS